MEDRACGLWRRVSQGGAFRFWAHTATVHDELERKDIASVHWGLQY